MTPKLNHRALQPAFSTVRGKINLWCLVLGSLALSASVAFATSTYDYGANEYVTVEKGMSPDHKYAITAHGGDGEGGGDHFHIYLTNAVTGRKIGPLEEIGQILDTGADAYCAKWSKNSDEVVIVWRIDRHEPLKTVSYHIANGRATVLKGPGDATKEQTTYWASQCGAENPKKEKVFGTPKK